MEFVMQNDIGERHEVYVCVCVCVCETVERGCCCFVWVRCVVVVGAWRIQVAQCVCNGVEKHPVKNTDRKSSEYLAMIFLHRKIQTRFVLDFPSMTENPDEIRVGFSINEGKSRRDSCWIFHQRRKIQTRFVLDFPSLMENPDEIRVGFSVVDGKSRRDPCWIFLQRRKIQTRFVLDFPSKTENPDEIRVGFSIIN